MYLLCKKKLDSYYAYYKCPINLKLYYKSISYKNIEKIYI